MRTGLPTPTSSRPRRSRGRTSHPVERRRSGGGVGWSGVGSGSSGCEKAFAPYLGKAYVLHGPVVKAKGFLFRMKGAAGPWRPLVLGGHDGSPGAPTCVVAAPWTVGPRRRPASGRPSRSALPATVSLARGLGPGSSRPLRSVLPSALGASGVRWCGPEGEGAVEACRSSRGCRGTEGRAEVFFWDGRRYRPGRDGRWSALHAPSWPRHALP